MPNQDGLTNVLALSIDVVCFLGCAVHHVEMLLVDS